LHGIERSSRPIRCKLQVLCDILYKRLRNTLTYLLTYQKFFNTADQSNCTVFVRCIGASFKYKSLEGVSPTLLTVVAQRIKDSVFVNCSSYVTVTGIMMMTMMMMMTTTTTTTWLVSCFRVFPCQRQSPFVQRIGRDRRREQIYERRRSRDY